MFIIEENRAAEGVVSALHPPEYDDYEQTFDSEMIAPGLEEIITYFEGKGTLLDIRCGRNHSLVLTEHGKLYSFGRGEFGVLGQGSLAHAQVPRPISKLQPFQFSAIACGEYHALALSATGDLYAWGRGFQGQLGITGVDCSASPLLVRAFQKFGKLEDNVRKLIKNPIAKIACGAFHSMAIDRDGKLFSWGEAKCGQTGTGRKSKEPLPKEVPVPGFIAEVSGGFGHSACVNKLGQLWVWGTNVKGQLGIEEQFGAKKKLLSLYIPTKVTKDSAGHNMPLMRSVSCGHSSTFAIDESGCLWSWGGGYNGHKTGGCQTLPKRVLDGTQDRRFTKVFTNNKSMAAFASMSVLGLKPKLGPSSGGTEITILGTGFVDTGRQQAKFICREHELLRPLEYDSFSDSFYCHSPNFEETGIRQWPQECRLEVSLDGQMFLECRERFLVYSSKLQMVSISPSCANMSGGTRMSLAMELDEETSRHFEHLTVGIRPRVEKGEDDASHSWTCVEGHYSKGQIEITLPRIDSPKSLFIVDVSLNGQQFTGMPSSFQIYDIKAPQMEPLKGLSEGGYPLTIRAQGLFDSSQKRIRFSVEIRQGEQPIKGERLIDPKWDKEQKQMTMVVPPASWLLGTLDPTPELVDLVKKAKVRVELTLNNLEWIPIGEWVYEDPQPPKEEEEEDKKKKDAKKDAKKKGK